MYQNVRGLDLVPLSSLGTPHPPLDTAKLLKFEGYVYQHEPDVIEGLPAVQSQGGFVVSTMYPKLPLSWSLG